MDLGRKQIAKSPVLKALVSVEMKTSAPIRVHLTKRYLESNPIARATRLFSGLGLYGAKDKNAVLFYINLRRKKFAIIFGEAITGAFSENYWKNFSKLLEEDLLSTHPENAIALAIQTLGENLKSLFPANKNNVSK